MENKAFIEVSARHIHLKEADLAALFGEGYQLTPKKELGGGFAAQERVTVAGPKGSLSSVAILGPCRALTQLEISLSDARALGIKPPVRMSGDVKGSAGGVTIQGPAGELRLEEGVIIAKRHIHMGADAGESLHIQNGKVVQLRVDTPERSLIFGDVVCRVGSKITVGPPIVAHIDTDEYNAAGMQGPLYGEIMV